MISFNKEQRYIVTGASSGIGEATALLEGAYSFGFEKHIDAANLIIYLLSDKSSHISGQDFILDSGGVL